MSLPTHQPGDHPADAVGPLLGDGYVRRTKCALGLKDRDEVGRRKFLEIASASTGTMFN
jgi:hypothetical protein